MKPANISDEDWEEALFTGIPSNVPDSSRPEEPVHVFLQRGESSCYIYLLEDGCLVRGKYLVETVYDIQGYIENNKDRYLGMGVFHNVQR